MNLYGEKVLLRAMEPEDMEMYREMVNDPDIEQMLGGWSFPVSSVEQRQWYERVAMDKRNLRFTIEDQSTGEALGMIYLSELDWKNRTAVYGMKLKKNAPKRKGYASDSEFTLMRYAFLELGFHRLSSEVLDYNTPSIGTKEKCGAKREGLKRSAVFKDGAYHDVICYGVLYEDFVEAVKRSGWRGNMSEKEKNAQV